METNDADRELAENWLSALRLRRVIETRAPDTLASNNVSPDAEDEVLAILVDESDPVRGWNLVMRMLEQARDMNEVRVVSINALETLLREQGDALARIFSESIQSSPRLREAIGHIYLSGQVADIARREGLYPHSGNFGNSDQ